MTLVMHFPKVRSLSQPCYSANSALQIKMRQKSSTKKKYRCWVLKWRWNGDHRRPNVDFCHLLPYQWSNDRVRGYVKALYANFQCDNHPSALALLKNTNFWNV